MIGAAVAYNLARLGAAVTIVDAAAPASAATADSFAWVGLAASAADAPQAALRRRASAELDRLGDQLPGVWGLRRNGALSWSDHRGHPTATLRVDPALAATVSVVDREEIRDREPALRYPPEAAVLAATDGSVDPVALTHALLEAAQNLGATLLTDTTIEAVLRHDAVVSGLRTATGVIAAKTVVLAAGTGTTALARTAGADVPVTASPCILLRLRTTAPLISGIVSGPDFELRQVDDHLLLAAEDYLDDSVENGPEAVAQRALEIIRREIIGAEDVSLERVAVGLRPIPADGRPIVGFTQTPGLYVATAHAAIALAAGIGHLAATEILHGADHKILASFRPTRF